MKRPALDTWLKEAKEDTSASECGMYLFHNGVVRVTPKAKVRMGEKTDRDVTAMEISYEEAKVAAAIEETYKMPGIYYVRVWLNQGRLSVGEDIMLVLIGGDIRPHVIDGLQALVGKLKNECIMEKEIFYEGTSMSPLASVMEFTVKASK